MEGTVVDNDMKELMTIADMIKDSLLRKKVKDFIKKPELTNKEFKYKAGSLKKAPASINWHHAEEGGLLKHTLAVSRMCMSIADVVEGIYEIEIDRDSLIAASLLHDMGKLWEYRKRNNAWTDNSITLDHTFIITSELYARGFPEHVIHIIASHFGSNGPTPPQTIEAFILHYADTLDAVIGTIIQDIDIKRLLSEL